MNIQSVKINDYTTFKSYQDDGIICCDDPVFQEIRNLIRKDYDKWHYDIPYKSIYEKGEKLNNTQLQLMIHSLRMFHDVQKIDDKLNIYRGQTLVERPYLLYDIKNKGVKTVVDLVGYGEGYKGEVEQVGLKYYSYNIFDNWWKKTDFDTEDIKTLVNFIKKVQKGNIYIGCQHGANDTDVALILNDFFNPLLEGKIKTTIQPSDSDFPIKLNTIYDLFTKEDKKILGWTTDFEKKLIKKLISI